MEYRRRAAALARTDLLTDMVGEFPELQGRMGYYYAQYDGEPGSVAVGIEEQYLPRQSGDKLPTSPVGVTLALADRADTLAGIFTLGKKPTGSKDPFGLRRQALGLVRILIEGQIDLDLETMLIEAAKLQPTQATEQQAAPEVVAHELADFIWAAPNDAVKEERKCYEKALPVF